VTVSQLFKGLALALALAMTAPLPASAQPVSSVPQLPAQGTWVNPYNSVKVETGDCGDNLCGWVVWATPEAEQEARDGGVQKLVSTELLQNYRQIGANRWQGRVFVPDMGRSFASTITLEDPGTLKISGCILGGLICKSQLWRKA
jgi:uncharacterized protein (DUF2147 family)